MNSMANAVSYLQRPGSVGVIPTDTVYGLVAVATDRLAVAKLYDLKQRRGKPGTILAASIDQLVDLGIKRRYLTAVADFWPGAISIILPATPELAYFHEGLGSLALRLPADPLLMKLLTQTGPLISSSANPASQPPAVTIDEARAYFGSSLDFYVDGGNLANRQPSTIIRVVDDAVEVLRPGAVEIENNGVKQ